MSMIEQAMIQHYAKIRRGFMTPKPKPPAPIVVAPVIAPPPLPPPPVSIRAPIDNIVLFDPPKPPAYPSFAEIREAVCGFYEVTRCEVESLRRPDRLVKPRHVLMYLAYLLTPASFPMIARHIGDRDHTTIMHAVKKIERLLPEDARLRDEVALIKLRIPGIHS